MPDRTFTHVVAGEPHQVTVAASGTGTATAGAIVVVVPNNMTTDDVERGLENAMQLLRREPNRYNGI